MEYLPDEMVDCVGPERTYWWNSSKNASLCTGANLAAEIEAHLNQLK